MKFNHTNKWNMHNPKSVLENETHKLHWDFEIQTDHQNSARRPDHIIINKKGRTCRIVEFAVPADHWVKLKEFEKRDNYLDLARELKKLWKMKVTIIAIVDVVLDTINYGVVQWLEDLEITGRLETVQTTAFFEIVQNTEKSSGDLRRLEKTCCQSDSSEKPSANASVK